jgi:Tol biopolymer transport system component
MKRVIVSLSCIMFILTTNYSFAESWKTGKLIFESYDIIDGAKRVDSWYMMNADGSDLKKLTESYVNDGKISKWYWGGVLSPDCKRVAFNLNNHDIMMEKLISYDVAVLDIDTGKIKNLTNNKKDDYSYLSYWSPDAKKIVFMHMSAPDYVNEICIINSDGSNFRKIGVREGYPLDWSPDGRTIVFAKNKGNIYTVYTMDINGEDVKVIVDGIEFVTDLRYSSDGKRIAFNVQIDGRRNRVYIMDSDGNNLKLLIELDGKFYCWSPDGKKLAMVTRIEPDNQSYIFIIDAEGGVLERLTNNDRQEGLVDWRDPALFHAGIESLSKSSMVTWGYVKAQK